jgi:hypothetical protein
MAKGVDFVAGVTDPGYSVAGFERGFVLAQVSPL